MNEVSLMNLPVTDSQVITKVIDAQATIKKLRDENSALRQDREDLLREHEDLRLVRPIVPFAAKPRRKVSGDKIRVSFGDMHGMRMDRAAVNALLGDIYRLNPDEVVMGGDMLECGGWLAKHHALGYVAQCDYSYQDDIAAANWFLDELQKAAPNAKAYYIFGNHEDRMEKWIVDETLGHQRDSQFLRDLVAPDVLLRLKEREITIIRSSDKTEPGLPYGWLKLGKMFYAHDVAGGKQAATKALAMTAGNVTCFHNHQESSSTLELVSVGIVKAFTPGCLCEKQPMWRHSHPSNWNHGYAIDVVATSGNFQHIQVPIWEGESLGCAMLDRK